MDNSQEGTIMRVKEIRIYPIKSIRGISLQSHQTTAMGFDYDRIFMLQRVEDNKNMHVPNFPSMCLFTTEMPTSQGKYDKLLVRFGLNHTFDQPEKTLNPEDEVLEIPLHPDVEKLKSIEYELHKTNAKGYVMPEHISKWFTDRFGFEVRLNYVGLNKRQPLGNLSPNSPRTYVGDPDPKKSGQYDQDRSWLGGFKAGLGNFVGTVATYTGMDQYKGVDAGLSFADVAPFLVINYASFLDVQGRVQVDVDVEKFRPNIVIEGTEEAWVEDYWGEIAIGHEDKGSRIAFTSNCARCASLNVDYATGKPAEGPLGQVLKSMQRDRRVDPGTKYSPIFGRYGFLSQKYGLQPDQPITINVGDEVTVTKVNERRTHFYWPGLN